MKSSDLVEVHEPTRKQRLKELVKHRRESRGLGAKIGPTYREDEPLESLEQLEKKYNNVMKVIN